MGSGSIDSRPVRYPVSSAGDPGDSGLPLFAAAQTASRRSDLMSVDGSCLCGTVRWRVSAQFARMSHCHCSMCRKAHAAPFATYAAVDADAFSYLQGEDALTVYESSPGFERPFCSRCGSAAPHRSLDGKVAVPAGCLDGEPGIRPEQHIFAASRAPWHVIGDDLPRYDGYKGDVRSPARERAPLPPGSPGVVRGSCLCGAVRYELALPFETVHNCHCSRCRKARAAAHTTNGFTPVDALRFVAGEDRLVTYRLPEARFFSQVFCATCGSGMPRADHGRGIAVVPLGSLDDDPGSGAVDHIFVGSKAPWYTIADELPRFEARSG
jgi:hypothetical protein